LTIEDGTDRLSQNVGKKLPLLAITQKNTGLIPDRIISKRKGLFSLIIRS
jgi:hypothetical protein